MLAPDGRCKTLDAAGDGYVRAENCIVLLLEALLDDVAACAIVQGSAVKQVGRQHHSIAQTFPTACRTQLQTTCFHDELHVGLLCMPEWSTEYKGYVVIHAGWPLQQLDGAKRAFPAGGHPGGIRLGRAGAERAGRPGDARHRHCPGRSYRNGSCLRRPEGNTTGSPTLPTYLPFLRLELYCRLQKHNCCNSSDCRSPFPRDWSAFLIPRAFIS